MAATGIDVEKIRSILLGMRAQVRAEGDVRIESEREGDPVQKPDEDAAPLAEMNQVIASSRNRERAERLAEIEAALGRIEADSDGFGLCEQCDEPIAARRLELMPWTLLCIACKQERERDGQAGGRRHITDYK